MTASGNLATGESQRSTIGSDNRSYGHRSLLLGAWGCGVFRNDPVMVADAFGRWLESPHFQGYFDRVVFGIYDSGKTKDTLTAFKDRFRSSN